MVTFGTVLARVFYRARPVVLLAVFPGEAWLAFALIPGTFMQALGFIFARFGYGARPKLNMYARIHSRQYGQGGPKGAHIVH